MDGKKIADAAKAIQPIKDLAQNTVGLEPKPDTSGNEAWEITASADTGSEKKLQAPGTQTESFSVTNDFLSQLLDSAPDGVVAINEKGEIILFNKQAEVLFGYKHEEIIGELLEMLMPDQFHHAHKDHLAEYIKKPTTRAMGGAKKELLGKRKNGAEFPIDISLSYFETVSGKIAISSIRDTTERKKAEQLLESQNTELKKINSELDRFVYSTSHDLRAPLMSVVGLIDLCLDTTETQEINQYLLMMKSSINRIDNTIREILVYSHNSRMELNIEQLDIRSIVNNQVESINHIKEAQNIRFKVNIQDSIPFFSDKIRVTTIINNLVTNAVKYQRANEPDPMISIAFIATSNEGIFRVDDNGEGISSEKQGRVFEMFYRNSVKSVGSGLGLYICKEIAGKMGGGISVNSELGKGSRFTVHLPNHPKPVC